MAPSSNNTFWENPTKEATALFYRLASNLIPCPEVSGSGDQRFIYAITNPEQTKQLAVKYNLTITNELAADRKSAGSFNSMAYVLREQERKRCQRQIMKTFLPSLPTFIAYLCPRVSQATIIAACIYLNRFRQYVSPNSFGTEDTRHRLVISSLLVAAKYLYDDGCKNKKWSMCVGAGFLWDVSDINSMEREFLRELKFDLTLSLSEMERWRQRSLDPALRHDAFTLCSLMENIEHNIVLKRSLIGLHQSKRTPEIDQVTQQKSADRSVTELTRAFTDLSFVLTKETNSLDRKSESQRKVRTSSVKIIGKKEVQKPQVIPARKHYVQQFQMTPKSKRIRSRSLSSVSENSENLGSSHKKQHQATDNLRDTYQSKIFTPPTSDYSSN